MSNLYVPIEYSNVSEAVPEGDDILYSTFCKVNKVGPMGTARVKSHAVVTQSGIGLCAMKKRKKQTALTFLEWDGLTGVKDSYGKTLFKWGRSSYKRIRIAVLRDSEYESKESFKDRQKKFSVFCNELWSLKVNKK